MRSLAAMAQGLGDNLLTRAAGVQLKERRPLVLLAREAPLTLAHLRNMTAATEMGAVILPPRRRRPTCASPGEKCQILVVKVLANEQATRRTLA